MLLLNHICEDYYIDRITLNALDFGVSQYRKRVFIVGVRKDMFLNIINKVPTIDNISSMDFPWPIPKYVNADTSFPWPIKIPFGTTPEKPKEIPIELCVESCLDNASELPNGIDFLNSRKI